MIHKKNFVIGILLFCSLNWLFAMDQENVGQENRHCLICFEEENLIRIPCANNHPDHYVMCVECSKVHKLVRCLVCRRRLPDCLETCPEPIKFCIYTTAGICTLLHVYYTFCNCS